LLILFIFLSYVVVVLCLATLATRLASPFWIVGEIARVAAALVLVVLIIVAVHFVCHRIIIRFDGD
jgi:hypothetical protein